MTGFALTLAIGLVVGSGCGLLLAYTLISLIEATGKAVDDLEDK